MALLPPGGTNRDADPAPQYFAKGAMHQSGPSNN